MDFTRNLSYHRALQNHLKDSDELIFWIHMYNNAIDLAVLDWFHLFGNHNDDLHWKSIVHNVDRFKQGLLQSISYSAQEWKAYHEKIKNYRDKDIAHIELKPLSHVPEMTQALRAAAYYYAAVLEELQGYAIYDDSPQDLNDYYEKNFAQAMVIAASAYHATLGIKEMVGK